MSSQGRQAQQHRSPSPWHWGSPRTHTGWSAATSAPRSSAGSPGSDSPRAAMERLGRVRWSPDSPVQLRDGGVGADQEFQPPSPTRSLAALSRALQTTRNGQALGLSPGSQPWLCPWLRAGPHSGFPPSPRATKPSSSAPGLQAPRSPPAAPWLKLRFRPGMRRPGQTAAAPSALLWKNVQLKEQGMPRERRHLQP